MIITLSVEIQTSLGISLTNIQTRSGVILENHFTLIHQKYLENVLLLIYENTNNNENKSIKSLNNSCNKRQKLSNETEY